MHINDCIDLESCMAWVAENTADESDFKNWISLDEDKAMAMVHHSLGMNLRNTLGLWHDGTSVPWFNKQGIYHADDMSGIILTSLHRKHNDIDIALDEQIKIYRDHWE